MSKPRFSIIVPHYQGVISHERFCRGIASLRAQSHNPSDVEILCYHDGPFLDAGVAWPIAVCETVRRFDDWGHSLRDIGIREARGEYILHFNPDNVLYPEALSRLGAIDDDIVVFPVRMMGLQVSRRLLGTPRYVYAKPRDYSRSVVLSGRPARKYRIDCMQLMMKTVLWRAEGGWSDKRYASDGILYERFARKYGVTYVDGPPLGEHW